MRNPPALSSSQQQAPGKNQRVGFIGGRLANRML
jgi:hypothetical protein